MSDSAIERGGVGRSKAKGYMAEPLARKSLAEQATERIYQALIHGEMKPGQRINEVELARAFGVSRNPVREALRRLEHSGLLYSEAGRGTFVRKLQLSDIDEIYSFRRTIEVFAARLAVKHLRPKELQSLEHLFDKMRASALSGSGVGTVENDLLFHRRICELSGNSRALRCFDDLSAEIRMLIMLVNRRYEVEEAVDDHLPILEALRTRDPDESARTIAEHIDEAWMRMSLDLEERLNSSPGLAESEEPQSRRATKRSQSEQA